jgi:pimeloyl-ACP methyl ester carboxylesterase
MKRALLLLFVLFVSLHAFAADVRVMKIDSAALAGNLTGDPTTQTFAVYLPPGYDQSTARYPVVFLLHGIADTFESWTGDWNIPGMLDRMIAAKKIEPLIVVMPNARNRFLGSFYVNSPVTGRWSDFIADELVKLVDATFRTIAKPESRGVIGHSMGGYGAIRFGMERPDVFRAVYAMSPCCLDTVEDIGWGNFGSWKTFLTFKSYDDADAALQKGEFYPVAILALLTAHVPHVGAPLNVDVPVRFERNETLPNDAAFNRLRDALPVHAVPKYRDNLRKLRVFAIDYGYDDQFAHIPVATPAFSRVLTEYRIPHSLAAYDGDHRQHIVERLERIVFPMFSAVLQR